jgi:predicted 2-oxoglutarate/Fe(II)-dependent dioxygenase YbiX
MLARTLVRDEYIFTMDDVLTPQECDHFIQLTEGIGYVPAPITTMMGPVHSPRTRNNTRVMVDDHDIAQGLWHRVGAAFEGRSGARAIGLNERIRFYRYEVGQRFARHLDGHYRRNRYERSLYTFMVYLNDDFGGGETTFFQHGDVIRPRKGMGIFFVHRQLHEGAYVTRGRKYVLRTDVMFDLRP